MVNVAVVRGNSLTKFEMQSYEKISSKFKITAICSLYNLFELDGLQLDIVKMPSMYDILRILPSYFKLGFQLTIFDLFRFHKFFGLEQALKKYEIIDTADIGYYYTYQCAKSKLKFGNKLIINQWENIPFNYGIYSQNYINMARFKIIVKSADVIIAKTNKAKKSLILEGVPSNKIVVIKPGVDIETFKPAPKDVELMHNLNLKGDEKIVLFIGRLNWRKGIFILIYAVKYLLDDLKSNLDRIKLVIVGSGRLKKKIQNLVSALNLSKNVLLVGSAKYNEMPKYHNLADVFVLPSVPDRRWQEQFGMVLIEAMACGKPVITTLSGSIPEVVEDKAILVQPFDFYELYKAIKKVLTDEHLAKEMGEKAREFVIQNYNAKDVANKIENVYNSLL